MKRRASIGLLFILAISVLYSCKCPMASQKKEEKMKTEGSMGMATPPLIIYKTKKDYNDKVPVILSEDKKSIVSYPGTKDVFYKGKLALPTELQDGYLLDNRGIDPNVAFLGITYDTYSKSMRVFSKNQLYDMIIDKDPIVEMYRCRRKGIKNIPEDINRLIESGGLKDCKRLK